MVAKEILGKSLSDLGINELLSDMNSGNRTELCKLPTDIIQPGKYQPRKDMDFEALEDLASSIRAQGIIQPIVVRPISNSLYEIIAGERRWRASQMAGLQEIPAVIRDIPDETAIALSLIENVQRENLNAIEEATALHRLLDEFNMTHQQVADVVGKSRTTVSNILRLLSLHPDVKKMLEHSDLDMGHARALLPLNQPTQILAAKTIIAKGMSVRAAERLVNNLLNPKEKPASRIADPNISHFQNKLADKLGAKVSIQHTQKGAGKLVIQYNSLDELEGILEHIG